MSQTEASFDGHTISSPQEDLLSASYLNSFYDDCLKRKSFYTSLKYSSLEALWRSGRGIIWTLIPHTGVPGIESLLLFQSGSLVVHLGGLST